MKVSAFYLEKQKSFIPKKTIFQAVVSKYAKRDKKDAFAVLIFSEGFDKNDKISYESNWGLYVPCPLAYLNTDCNRPVW